VTADDLVTDTVSDNHCGKGPVSGFVILLKTSDGK
jgi:hypothetical protein